MLAVLFVCKILYEACYTMFNIPMGSLLGAMANNDGERSTLSSARGFGSLIGNMLPLMILPQLLAKYGDTSFAFGMGAAICAVIGFVFCLLHYFWTEERNLAVVEAAGSGSGGMKVSDIFDLFRKNRAFLALIIHGICICTQQYVASTLGSYMYGDVLGDIGIMSTQSAFSMVLSLGTLALCPVVSKKIGLEKMVRACLLLGSALYLGLYAAVMTMDIAAAVYMVWSSFASGFCSVSIFMQWGLVATVTDYNEYISGKRAEGTIYGVFNLSRRIGQTIGNSAAVLALGWIGYQAGVATQSAATITGIKTLCLVIPAIALIGSWVAFKFVWNITPEIRAELTARKAQK